MKKYIGTKQIEAKPMTRGDYNAYRGWTIPENENPNDAGYIVKYSDNYVSWSPKKQFEEAYREIGTNPLMDSVILMQSNNFKDRFKAEYYQLLARMKGLNIMLKKYKAGTLPFIPKCSYEILMEQFSIMENYKNILESRAYIEDIEL